MKIKALLIALLVLLIAAALFLIKPWENRRDREAAAQTSCASPPVLVNDSTADLPDSLFRYHSFTSTSDSTMFGTARIPECSEEVKTSCLSELDSTYYLPVAGAVASLLHCDAAWVVQATNLVPLSKIKLQDGAERLIFWISGDDMGGLIMVNKPSGQKANYAVFLQGGVDAGPNYEDDSIFASSTQSGASLATDTLLKTYGMIAIYKDSARGSISDSGRALFLLKPDGMDTLSIEGTTRIRPFLKAKFNIEDKFVGDQY